MLDPHYVEIGNPDPLQLRGLTPVLLRRKVDDPSWTDERLIARGEHSADKYAMGLRCSLVLPSGLGKPFTWEQVGHMLMTSEGFTLEAPITDTIQVLDQED